MTHDGYRGILRQPGKSTGIYSVSIPRNGNAVSFLFMVITNHSSTQKRKGYNGHELGKRD